MPFPYAPKCQTRHHTYLFDKFFVGVIVPIDKWEGSHLDSAGFAMQHFHFSAEKEEWADFAAWLDGFTQTGKFIRLSTAYIEIHKKLKYETERDKRWSFSDHTRQLKNDL